VAFSAQKALHKFSFNGKIKRGRGNSPLSFYEILDGGTTVVVGNVTTTTLVATTQNAATAPISPQYASAERTIYCNVTNTVDATTAGSFTFIVEYVQIA
jgi:hypothetical protein